MSNFSVRMIRISRDEIWRERGPSNPQPLLVGSALAVINNPYAGRYEPDLLPMQTALRDLGRELAGRLAEELGGIAKIEAYGKGMIVGEDGELEHAAVWHEAGGWAMREVLNQPKQWCPPPRQLGRSVRASWFRSGTFMRPTFGATTQPPKLAFGMPLVAMKLFTA
jgi:hypothetical protein